MEIAMNGRDINVPACSTTNARPRREFAPDEPTEATTVEGVVSVDARHWSTVSCVTTGSSRWAWADVRASHSDS
jgi:hypothetical protein